MFSSIFSTSAPVDPNAQNFHPATENVAPNELFGKLEAKDTEWTCAGGFVTETQVWYHFLDDGTHIMCQIIHSAVGLWYPTIQFTCRIFNPTTNKQTWKSINVTNFVTPPPGKDKRSSKADEFTVTHSPGTGDIAEQYAINANLGTDVQLALTVSRPASAAGFKVAGGESHFGVDVAKRDGYVVHRFWPRTQLSGHIIQNGKAIEANGIGMFVHAIQGMRPNLVAARWNFATFQSKNNGVSAVQMDFSTIDAYGKHGAGSGGVTVSVGGVVVEGKLVSVSGETIWKGDTPAVDAPVQSRATHLAPALDPETGYRQPTKIHFIWKGPALGEKGEGNVKAEIVADVGTPDAPKGLVQKVDVLAEIPYAIKMVVNYVAGTKPYIYQWLNPGTLSITGPESVIPGGSMSVEGTFYNEATFISE